MSAIDVTVPAYGDPTTQSVRDNFSIAASEISTLQAAIPTLLPLDGSRSMTGLLTLSGNPTAAMHAVPRQYADAIRTASLPLLGGTMQGPLLLEADPTDPMGAATRQFVLANAGSGGDFLPLTGGTIDGVLQIGDWVQPATPPIKGTVVADFVSMSGLLGNYLFNATVDQNGTGFRYMTDGPAAAISINNQGDVGFYAAQPGVAGALLTFGPTMILGGQGNLTMGDTKPPFIAPADPIYGGQVYALNGISTIAASMNCYYDGTNYRYATSGLGAGIILVGGAGATSYFTFQVAVSGTQDDVAPDLSGDIYYSQMSLSYDGSLSITGTLYQGSDIRRKTNIQPATQGLAEVLAIEPITYTRDGGEREQLGFSAQQLRDALPHAVIETPPMTPHRGAAPSPLDAPMLGVESMAVLAACVNAIKELAARSSLPLPAQ
jgi:hypothetical protein